MSLITLGLALDFKTAAGTDPTSALTALDRPMGWQQIERTRANLVILNDLAPIKLAQVTLTDAQIKALPTTPITLIAAPGSGLTIVPISASIFCLSSAGAYTNVNATYSALAIYWLGDFTRWAMTPVLNDTGTAPDLVNLADLLSAAKHLANLIPYHDGPATTPTGWVVPGSVPSTQYENKALAIAGDNNGSGAYTGGNAANTMKVSVLYLVL
jgi:hypothetical protein